MRGLRFAGHATGIRATFPGRDVSKCEQLPRCSHLNAAMRFPPLAAFFLTCASLRKIPCCAFLVSVYVAAHGAVRVEEGKVLVRVAEGMERSTG